MDVEKIYEDAGLNEEEIFLMESYLEGIEEFEGSEAYEKLFEYFAYDSGEMSQDVIDGNDGKPSCWILDKLTEILEG